MNNEEKKMHTTTSKRKQPFKWWKVAAVAALSLGVMACTQASGILFGLLGKEFTGTVIDAETKQPIEGAYVLAKYSIVRSGMAATTAWCVKTKGMVTGMDGKFRFPIAGLNSLPPNVVAIKADYFLAEGTLSPAWNLSPRSEAAYRDWDITLGKQNSGKPDPRFNDSGYCNHAETKEDAAASVVYLKLVLAEYKKYRPMERRVGWVTIHDAIASQIQRLESLPPKNSIGKSK